MSQPLEWEGTARGRIVEFGVREVDSGAVGISLIVKVSDYYDLDSSQWISCEAEDYEVGGTTWVTKKDGTPNTKAVESLCQYAGWLGDLTSVSDGTWQPTPCAIVISKNEYKGNVRYEIAFINDFNRTPGLVGNVSPEKAKALQDRFGAQFRALAGNVQRNTTAPTGKPPVPAAKKPSLKPAKKLVEEGVGTGVNPPPQSAEDIPF